MATAIAQQIIAGPFSVDYRLGISDTAHATTNNLGIITRGVREIIRYKTEEVQGDLLGESTIDGIHLGGDCFLEFELEEANIYAVMLMAHPFTVLTAATLTNTLLHEGQVGVPGTALTDAAGSLLLTPSYGVAGSALNSAGAQDYPVRRYKICTLAPNFEMNKLLASRKRTFALRMRAYPFYDSSTQRYKYYTKSSSSPA